MNTAKAVTTIRGRIILSERSRIEDEAVGFIVVDKVGIGNDVGTGWFRLAVAWGFATVKTGIKVTVPKLASFLKSWMVWLIAWASVVPHQLLDAVMLGAIEP